MATVKWNESNGGVRRYDRWDEFDGDIVSDTKVVLTWDYENGDFDPERYPFKIELIFDQITYFTPISGPYEGEEQPNGGELQSIKFRDIDNNVIMTITDFDPIPITVLAGWADGDEDLGRKIFELIGFEDNLYTGSNEAIVGDEEGDNIRTGKGDDTVYAKDGHDWIADGGGADFYHGGDGWDTLSYHEVYWNTHLGNQGITVDLKASTIIGYDGETDTVKKIEEVMGTYMDDLFIGDGNDNKFSGMNGADSFDGGNGFDVVSYRNEVDQGGLSGIQANMGAGTVIDAWGNTDTMTKIEGVEGTDFADWLRDSNKDDYLRGRDGDDIFNVGKGDDYLRGDGGADMFIFRGNNLGFDEIEDFNFAEGDQIKIKNANAFGDLTIQQDGSDTEILWNGNTILLQDTVATDVTSDWFVF